METKTRMMGGKKRGTTKKKKGGRTSLPDSIMTKKEYDTLMSQGGRKRKGMKKGGFSFGDFLSGVRDVVGTVGQVVKTGAEIAPHLLPLLAGAGKRRKGRRRGGAIPSLAGEKDNLSVRYD